MKNIVTLKTLYKRDTTGKVRMWQVEYGESDNLAGTRTISGLVDGQKVTSEWNMSSPKNTSENYVQQIQNHYSVNFQLFVLVNLDPYNLDIFFLIPLDL